MKEIYVIKNYFDHRYKATTLEEIEKITNDGISLVHAVLYAEDVTINLYEEVLFMFFGIPENKGNEMIKDYLEYVSSITGWDIPEIG